MKVKIIIHVLLVILSINCYSQNIIQGLILDKQTMKPLPYATIACLQNNYGTYSDSTGHFYLKFLNERDSLQISYLGYLGISTTAIGLKEDPKILLEPIILQLKSVIISPRKYKTVKLGNFHKICWAYEIPYGNANQEGLLIPNTCKGKDVIIQTLKFSIQLADNYNSPLRIRLLKVSPSGSPGEDLLAVNVILEKSWVKINNVCDLDLRQYNLFLPREGIFVVFEWINLNSNIRNEKMVGPYIGVKGRGVRWTNNFKINWDKNESAQNYSVGITVKEFKE